MREKIFKALWEMSESAYTKGTSKHINVLPEKKYELFLDKIEETYNEILFDFFIWFRENGEKYMNESIEKMIQIYLTQEE